MASPELKRVRMLTSIAGATWAADRGDEIDISGDLADRLVARGQAEPVPTAAEDFVRLAEELEVTAVVTRNEAVTAAAAAAGLHVREK